MTDIASELARLASDDGVLACTRDLGCALFPWGLVYVVGGALAATLTMLGRFAMHSRQFRVFILAIGAVSAVGAFVLSVVANF